MAFERGLEEDFFKVCVPDGVQPMGALRGIAAGARNGWHLSEVFAPLQEDFFKVAALLPAPELDGIRARISLMLVRFYV